MKESWLPSDTILLSRVAFPFIRQADGTSALTAGHVGAADMWGQRTCGGSGHFANQCAGNQGNYPRLLSRDSQKPNIRLLCPIAAKFVGKTWQMKGSFTAVIVEL